MVRDDDGRVWEVSAGVGLPNVSRKWTVRLVRSDVEPRMAEVEEVVPGRVRTQSRIIVKRCKIDGSTLYQDE